MNPKQIGSIPPASAENRDSAPAILESEVPARVRGIPLSLGVSNANLTICDPCRFFSNDLDPRRSLILEPALSGHWSGTALALLAARGFEVGISHFELALEGAGELGDVVSRHVLVDSGLIFCGDGAKVAALAQEMTWHEFLDRYIHPALALPEDQKPITQNLSQSTESFKNALQKPGSLSESVHELEALLLSLAKLQWDQAERGLGLIEGMGYILRPECGDGNYPLKMRRDAQERIISFTLDLNPYVDEMVPNRPVANLGG